MSRMVVFFCILVFVVDEGYSSCFGVMIPLWFDIMHSMQLDTCVDVMCTLYPNGNIVLEKDFKV